MRRRPYVVMLLLSIATSSCAYFGRISPEDLKVKVLDV